MNVNWIVIDPVDDKYHWEIFGQDMYAINIPHH